MQFSDLPIDHRILKALELKNLTETTEIQSKAIPYGLMQKDLIASSKTGSGKTLAYLIPAVNRVLNTKALSRKDPRVLILAPTRELAKQVFMQLKWLIAKQPISAALVLGGENFNDQVKALKRHPQFIVGTAGRVCDHLFDKSLYLNGLELLILDEADRMLDLGFAPQLKNIDKAADHRKRQTMMFSATLDNAELHHLTQEMLTAPHRIAVGQANEQHTDINQRFYLADHLTHKEAILDKLLDEKDYRQLIVFTATRVDAERISARLSEQGKHSVALTGELTQSKRNNIMSEFGRGQHQILVTTDIASRGLDLRNVELVVNFDLPTLADEYVHRVGRTGRAGNQGEAASIVGPKDWVAFERIRNFLQQSIEFSEFEGLEPKFKGLTIKPAKVGKDIAKGAKKGNRTGDKTVKRKPIKRINTLAGTTDVGHVPLKRKPRVAAEQQIEADNEEE